MNQTRSLFLSISLLLSVGINGQCRLENPVSYDLDGPNNPVAVAFSPNGQYVATLDSGITLFGNNNGVLTKLDVSSPNGEALVFAQDEEYLITSRTASNELNIFRVENGELSFVRSFAGDSGRIALSPNGLLLAVVNGGGGGVLTTYNYTQGFLNQVDVTGVIGSGPVTFSPDGRFIAVASTNANFVTMVSHNAGIFSGASSYAMPNITDGPSGVVFSTNGQYLITANRDSVDATVFTHNEGVLTSPVTVDLPDDAIPFGIAIHPNGEFVAFPNNVNSDSNVPSFQFANGILSGAIDYSLPSESENPRSLAFSADGRFLATANYLSDDVTIFRIVDCGGSNIGDGGDGDGNNGGSSSTASTLSSVLN